MITTIDRIRGGPSPGPVQRPDPSLPASTRAAAATGLSGSADTFAEELAAAAGDRPVALSGHALRRIEQRRIELGDGQLERLGRAMDMLAARGGRTSLVMLDQVAYVVHVPSHTVVTAVPQDDRKEAVFTRIDSVAIA